MAINNFYPSFYPGTYQQPQQMQAGSFVSVRSIEEAYNWPVAPGNSVTFRVENTPYVCTKTKGFSPLDQPVFDRYRLVKEEEPQKPPEQPADEFDAHAEIDRLWDEIKTLKQALKKEKKHVQSANADSVQAVHE